MASLAAVALAFPWNSAPFDAYHIAEAYPLPPGEAAAAADERTTHTNNPEWHIDPNASKLCRPADKTSCTIARLHDNGGRESTQNGTVLAKRQ